MTIGAAASKSTPLTLDAVEYYNRIIGFPADDFTASGGLADDVQPVRGPEHRRADGDR